MEEYTYKSDQTLTEDQQRLKDLDPEQIDFGVADPDKIGTIDEALKVLKYLKTLDKGMSEETYMLFLMDKFDIVAEDPTDLTLAEKKLVAGSFYTFCKYMFLVEYGFKFKNNWHHDMLCTQLEELFLGKATCPRIIINIPPRYSKTQILIYYVAWTMGHVPDSEYILIGYAKSLSEESSFKVRECILNDKYQSIFNITLDKSSKAKDNFKTSKGGRVYATSTGGMLTGKGAGKLRKSWGGCIILDDPNNTSDAFSEAGRNMANRWISGTLLSRRNDVKNTPIIIIQQRVHENDVSGFILPTKEKPLGETGESYNHIEVPAILTREQLDKFNVPEDSPTIVGGDPAKDEYPLWEYKIDLAKLRSMRENLPVLTFFGQYQQRPFAQDGAILKSKWIGVRPTPKDQDIKYCVFVLDTAQTVSKHSDFTVLMVAFVLNDSSVFIENIIRERLEAPALAELTLEMYGRYKPRKIYIEYKSSGIGLVQYLKTEAVPLPIEPITRNAKSGDGDSVLRANGISSYVKCGYVSMKEGAPWISVFVQELMTFPTGTHDDQVDALIDLVGREVMITGNYLAPMSVDALPLGDSTYGEVVSAEQGRGSTELSMPTDGSSYYDYLMSSGISFRKREKNTESGRKNWLDSII